MKKETTRKKNIVYCAHLSKVFNLRFSLVVFILLVFPFRIVAQHYSPLSVDGTWSTASSDGFTPRYALSSTVVDGKIYVIGGEGNFDFLNTLEIFDPATNTWSTPTTTGTFTPHFGHTSSAVNGKIYVFGGTTAPTLYDSNIYVFDPGTNNWSTIVPREGATFTPRWDLTSCVLDGKIYVIGGDTGEIFYPYTPSNIVEVFDPATATWSRPAITDTMRTLNFLNCHVINGKIYAVGTIDDKHYSVITQVFDPVTNKWSTIEPIGKPSSRIYFTSSVLNEKIYIIGQVTPDIEMFDPLTNTWTTLSTTGSFTQRSYLTSSTVGGKIYVMGGEGSGEYWLNTNEVFTPATSEVKNNNYSPLSIFCFPNPITTETHITYSLPKRSDVQLRAFDMTGKLAATIASETDDSGSHEVLWDTRSLPTGSYVIELSACGETVSKIIEIVK